MFLFLIWKPKTIRAGMGRLDIHNVRSHIGLQKQLTGSRAQELDLKVITKEGCLLLINVGDAFSPCSGPIYKSFTLSLYLLCR